MAKLYFRYGTVSSAKTLNLLAVAHNYEAKQRSVFLIRPRIDTRFGPSNIRSGAGFEREADLLVDDDSRVEDALAGDIACILVDECQFLSPQMVDQLRNISVTRNIPVICYGLRTDFQTHLFDGAKRLMEVADAIEEVKTVCSHCSKKAIFNARHVNGKMVKEGEQILLGKEDKYLPLCANCYHEASADL